MCGLKYLKKPKRILISQEDDDNKRMLKELKWDNIRIHLDFSAIENNLGKFNKTDLIFLRDHIMKKAKSVFEKILKVRPTNKKLRLTSEKCDEVAIPELYRESEGGVEADLVIFVALDDTGFYKANKIEAAATYCLQDESTKRPIAGFINFRPGLNIKNSTNFDYMVWLALHEMSHILAFNEDLYPDFINENLEALNITDVIGSVILKNQKKMSFLKTKKIVEKGRQHFNCSDLEGVPLEFMGGTGTSGSHWSKRVMNTDYMIGDSYGENLISEITLALFEDSGWYKVDYSQANLFLWGKNKGCGFLDVNKICIKASKNNTFQKGNSTETHSNELEESDEYSFTNKNAIKNKTFLLNSESQSKADSSRTHSKFPLDIYETEFSPEFCSKLNYPICSISNIFRATCKVKKFTSPLSPHEIYFKDSFIGGVNNFANKCPIAIEDKENNIYYSGSCRKGTTRSNQLKEEKICPECSCFMANLSQKTTGKEEYKPYTKANIQQKQSTTKKNKSVYQENLALPSINSKNFNQAHSVNEVKNRLNLRNASVTIQARPIEEKIFDNDHEDDEEEDAYNINNTLEGKQNRKFLRNEMLINNSFSNKEKINFDKRALQPILTQEDYRARCFGFKCKDEKLFVLIDDEEYDCAEGKVKIPGYDGHIVCPNYNILCDKRYKCKFGCTEHYDNDNKQED